MADPAQLLAAVAALAAAASAGIYHVFHATVMPSLAGGPPVVASATMRTINKRIVRTGFMPLFLGSGVLALGSCLVAPLVAEPLALPMAAAGALYLFGSIGVTMMGNVPLNRRLDSAPTADVDAWNRFARRWCRLNLVRTIASLLAALIWIAVAIA